MTPDTLDRRRFTAAVLGSAATIAGATALGSLLPEQALAAPAWDVEPGAVDPNFAEGVVSNISDSKLFVTGSDGVFHRIQATQATSVWKLNPTTFEAAQVGDGLYARGVRLPDGVLAAESIWLNIVNLEVHLVSVSRNMLHLEHFGGKIVGHVSPGRSATVYNGTPAVNDMSLLKVGTHIKVVGAWRPGTNEIDIATVYAAV
jgi:hypothetical protein